MDASAAATPSNGFTSEAWAGGRLDVQMLAPGVLHVHFVPASGATPPTLVMDPQGWSGPAFKPTVTRHGDAFTLRSDRMSVTMDPKAGTLIVADARDNVLLRQTDPATSAQGRIVFDHAPGIAWYGIGSYSSHEDVSAGLLRDGHQVAKAGKQGHAGAPFVWSTAGFGVLVDCDGAEFDLAANRITISHCKRPDANYYILVGTPAQMFGSVAKLSGPAPLFPKWSLGFLNSQWGIDQQELLSLVHTYRAKHIPIDAFILDFDWKAWGQGDYGEFRWNPEKFPDGASGKLAQMLDAEGVHLAGIMKPRLLLGTAEGDYATAHDLWIPGEKPYPEYFSHKQALDVDFDKPAARSWFGRLAVKYGFDHGIAGWWNDEADVYGKDGTPTSNTQFLNMQRALYDAQRAASDTRVWSINRNFWLGAQRYAYGMWSGDIDTGFASMAAQRARMLSAIDVGEMNWGMDGGGFNGHPSDENYARWIEFGAFTPIFRVHGTFGEKRQPWVYGPVAEAAATSAIRLRCHLLPYTYAYQYTNHAHGVGLVRPLTFGWPHDPKVRNDVDAWLFGQWLLVSPVVKQGETTKHIYLPAGTWTDWSTGKAYAGGQTITLPVDAKTWRDIPLFIRAGAIIPTQPVMDYVGQRPVKSVTVQVFPSDHATHFDYYDDDGRTYAYEKDAYFLQAMTTRQHAGEIEFKLAVPQGAYKPALRNYLLAIHGGRGKSVQMNGKALASMASLDALEQAESAGWAAGQDRFGDVTWVKVPAGEAQSVRIATVQQ
ncbi:MAG TPA: TIM-barrel domain-containing protein [Rhodanobacteraceae bacterium]|nr:TIM-barrel domain-containing protein [Rhodanobacteraceae bacterium]